MTPKPVHRDSCVCSEHKNMVPRVWLLVLVTICGSVLGFIFRACASVESVAHVERRVEKLEKRFDGFERTLQRNHAETLAAIRAVNGTQK